MGAASARVAATAAVLVVALMAGRALAVGERLERLGDEIMVAGQLFHTGTPVVLCTPPHSTNTRTSALLERDAPREGRHPPALAS